MYSCLIPAMTVFFKPSKKHSGSGNCWAILDEISDYELVTKLIIGLLNVQRNIDVRRVAVVCRYYSGRDGGAPRPPTDRQQHTFCTAGTSQTAQQYCCMFTPVGTASKRTVHTTHLSHQ